MIMSIVRIIMNSFVWMAFGFGMILNGIMVHLIVRHTPKIMRIYSNILLQTCATDIAVLGLRLFFHQYQFTTAKGANEIILDGLIINNGSEELQWFFLFGAIFWIFLVYVSLFGYVAQFIFRYLVLNWNKRLTTFKYFVLLITILIFPFLICLDVYICNFPPADHRFLEDQSVADILGLNLTDHQIALTGYSYKDWRMAVGLYCIIILCFNCICNYDHIGDFDAQILEGAIQENASMPFFIYASISFFLTMILLKIDMSQWKWLKYYNLLSAIPLFLPSVLNPIVSICIMQHYRKVSVTGIKKFFKWLKLLLFRQQTQSPAEATDQWALRSIPNGTCS